MHNASTQLSMTELVCHPELVEGVSQHDLS